MSVDGSSGSTGFPFTVDFSRVPWSWVPPRHKCCAVTEDPEFEDEETERTASGDSSLLAICGPFNGVTGYEAFNISILTTDVYKYHWNGASYDYAGEADEGYSIYDVVRIRFGFTITRRDWTTADGAGITVKYTRKVKTATRVAPATPDPSEYLGPDYTDLTRYVSWTYADTVSAEIVQTISIPDGTAIGTTVWGSWITFTPYENTLEGWGYSGDPSVQYTNECLGD